VALKKSFSQFNLKSVEQGTAKAELVSDMTPLMSQVVVLCVFTVLVQFSSGRTRPLKLVKRNTYLRGEMLFLKYKYSITNQIASNTKTH